MMHDLALLRSKSLVLGVIGVNGVACVIGVAAKPATSRKAKKYAGYARYAPGAEDFRAMQMGGQFRVGHADSIVCPVASALRSKRGTGPDLAEGNHSRLPSRVLSKLTETSKKGRETDVYSFQN